MFEACATSLVDIFKRLQIGDMNEQKNDCSNGSSIAAAFSISIQLFLDLVLVVSGL